MKKEPKCSVCPDDVKSIPKNLKKYQVGTRTYTDPKQYEEAAGKYRDSLDLYITNNNRLQNLLKLNKQAGATNRLEYSNSIPKDVYESANTMLIAGSKKYKKLGEDFESLEHPDIDPIDSWKLTELYDKYKAPAFIKEMGLFDSKEEGFVDYGLVYKKPVQLPIFKKAEEKKQQSAVKPTPPAAQEKKVEVVNPRVIVKKLDTKGNIVEQDTVSPTSVNKRFDSATKTWKQKLQLGGDLKKYQVESKKTPISTMVEGSANSRIGTESAFTEEGSRLINSYAGGLPNDTSYIYHNPSESYFYNTNRGAPIENRLFANPNTSKEEYIKKVNSMIPKYQVGGPTYSGGMLPMATVSSPMSESPIARNLRVKKALQEGRDVNTAKTAKEREFENTVKELSGAGSVERIYNNPKKTAVGTAKALANIAALPVGVGQGLSEVVRGKEFNMGNNPLTGGKYSEGFDEALDVATVLPAMGLAGKGLNMFKKANMTKRLSTAVIPTIPAIDNTVIQSAKQAWKLQELPGLHLQSTMEGGAINRIVEPKTGLVNIEQALGIIGKEAGGADKVALIKKGLGEIIPKKIDFNDFRKITQEQLIPLERQFVDYASDYGINRLGYKEPEFITRNVNGKTINELTSDVIENQTLVLSNKGKFGRGSSAHGNPEETLGHIHFLRDAETPDALIATQIQSDAFQGTHRIMPKNALDVSKVEKSLQRMQELQERNKSVLNKMKTEGVDEAGLPVQQYQIKQFEDIVQTQEAANLMKKGEAENFIQKQLLDKNHQERYLQELVDYAGKRGDVSKIRVPTSETAAKVQGYTPVTKTSIGPITTEQLKKATSFDEFMALKKDEIGDYVLDSRELDTFKKIYNEFKSGVITPTYEPAHQTILKKYLEQPKTIKKLFGEEPRLVTDSKNNSWYEFNIPKKFKEGKGEIKAFTTAATIAGTGAETLRQSKGDGKGNLPKYQLGTVYVNSAQDPRNLAYLDSTQVGRKSMQYLQQKIKEGSLPNVTDSGRPVRRIEDLLDIDSSKIRSQGVTNFGVVGVKSFPKGDPAAKNEHMPRTGLPNKPTIVIEGPYSIREDLHQMPKQEVVVRPRPTYTSVPIINPNISANFAENDALPTTTKIPNSISFAKSQGSYDARGQKRFNVETRQWEEIPKGWFNKGKGKGIEDLPKRQLGGELPKFQLAGPMPTKQQYQDSIQTNYQPYLEKTGGASPLPPGVNLGMNCINGVCNFIKGTNAHKFEGKGYTGNATFNDEREKNGYYEADWRTTGFEVGDVVQYARTKDNAERIDGMKITPKNAKELYPQHAKVILNTRVDDRGRKMYTIGHNGGGIKFTTSEIAEEELMRHGVEGYGTYNGLIVNRYDPEKVKENKAALLARQAVFQGNNEHASKYNTPPNFIYKGAKGAKSEQNMVDYFKKNYQALGRQSNMSPETLHKAFTNIVGIGHQESDLGGNMEVKMPQFLMDESRKVRDALPFQKEDDWKKDYWKSNADGVQSKYKSEAEFKKALASRSSISPEVSEYLYLNSPRSKGIFKQKELSERGRFFDSNLDSEEKQFVSAMQLYMDNYDVVKKKYPGKTDDEYLDLATLMHNAPSKVLTPEYVEYYQKNNKMDYVNKVKAQRGELVIGETFKPSGTNLIGAKDSTLANATPAPRIVTPTKLSPKEVETLKAFMSKK